VNSEKPEYGWRRQMSKQQRWIKSIVDTSKAEMPALPWARGTRRAAFVTKRSGQAPKRKSA
jgi:hypothetical protein